MHRCISSMHIMPAQVRALWERIHGECKRGQAQLDLTASAPEGAAWG